MIISNFVCIPCSFPSHTTNNDHNLLVTDQFFGKLIILNIPYSSYPSITIMQKNLVWVLALAAGAVAAPTTNPAGERLELGSVEPVEYITFRGDGSYDAGWPSDTDFKSFEELLAINAEVMRSSCGWHGWGVDDSEQEIADIRTAINQIAGETGIDERFILSVVMQESKGCVRAPTTDNGVRNPGLMQSHNGETSCANDSRCPYQKIEAMIREGVRGTGSGEGLEQILASFGSVGVTSQQMYAAARRYNSGSVDRTDLNNAFTSTVCYSTDIANRLRGWASQGSGCQL